MEGRSFGGYYLAMKDGPSQAYDIVKAEAYSFHDKLIVHGYGITPRVKDVDLDVLSDSDIEVLDKTISELGGLTTAQLRAKAHDDPAWSECARNSEMDFVAMLKDAEKEWVGVILDDQAVRELVDDVSLTEEPTRT